MAKAIVLPPQKYLRECFDYNPETGSLIWRARPLNHFIDEHAQKAWNGRYAGCEISYRMNRGYLSVVVNYRRYLVHRIIWKWMTGNDPENTIDHRDHQRDNNRWKNFRLADLNQQQHNRTRQRTNRTGYKGVGYYSAAKTLPYRADIWINNQRIIVGWFATAQKAHQAYCAAARKHFGKFWCAG